MNEMLFAIFKLSSASKWRYYCQYTFQYFYYNCKYPKCLHICVCLIYLSLEKHKKLQKIQDNYDLAKLCVIKQLKWTRLETPFWYGFPMFLPGATFKNHIGSFWWFPWPQQCWNHTHLEEWVKFCLLLDRGSAGKMEQH